MQGDIKMDYLILCYISTSIIVLIGGKINHYGAVKKLRNGQRGEGVDDFVTYRYVYLRGRGGIL